MDKTALEKYKNLQDLSHDQKLLLRLFEGLNMYYNLTGSTECLDYDDETSNGFTELDGQSFDYQVWSCKTSPIYLTRSILGVTILGFLSIYFNSFKDLYRVS